MLKKHGFLADLGCGDGSVSEPFFESGYHVLLVDKDKEKLSLADGRFHKVKDNDYELINEPVEKFDFDKSFDGIIMSNILPFIHDKSEVKRIVKTAFDNLKTGGFIYFTLFGVEDEWVDIHANTMSFYSKTEALGILDKKPYFTSEDFGKGLTMKGDIKTWHIFALLYLK